MEFVVNEFIGFLNEDEVVFRRLKCVNEYLCLNSVLFTAASATITQCKISSRD